MKGSNSPSILAAEFWDYSLFFYGHNNNQAHLLGLQDSANMNVNIVLLIIYLRAKGYTLNTLGIIAIHERNQELDSLTSTLRKQRRALKSAKIVQGDSEDKIAQYDSLLAQELALEKQQHTLLIDEAKRWCYRFSCSVNDEERKELTFLNLATLCNIGNCVVAVQTELTFMSLLNEQATLTYILSD